MVTEKELVVVHSDEAYSLQYNPITHEVIDVEVEPGNHILRIAPKQQSERTSDA